MTAIRAGLTEAQLRAFAFIAKYIDKNGKSPSHSEIAAAIDAASKSTVTRLLDSLVERGYVIRLPYRARSVAIVPDAQESQTLTAFGVLTAEQRRQIIAFCERSGDSPTAFIQDAVSLYLDQRTADIDRDGAAAAEGLPTLHEVFK